MVSKLDDRVVIDVDDDPVDARWVQYLHTLAATGGVPEDFGGEGEDDGR